MNYQRFLQTVQDKTFPSKFKIYKVFHEYDVDSDGYVSLNDLK